MSAIKVNCENIEISNSNKICIIAGPCQLETEQHAIDMAGKTCPPVPAAIIKTLNPAEFIYLDLNIESQQTIFIEELFPEIENILSHIERVTTRQP